MKQNLGILLILLCLNSCEKEKGTFEIPCIARKPMLIVVEVKNNIFVPATVNSIIGDTVKWVWVEGFHTTTSTSVPAGAAGWDSPIDNSPTASFQYRIAQNGTYSYVCTIHETMGMTGTIIATDPCQ